MARVKIEEIINHLGSQMRTALRAALYEVAPSADIDGETLFRAFKRAIGRKCNTWERAPDRYVEIQ